MNDRIRALAMRATEIKQANDHCSGQSEAWSEVNLDTYARLIVQECIDVIKHSSEGKGQVRVDAADAALRSHFGFD